MNDAAQKVAIATGASGGISKSGVEGLLRVPANETFALGDHTLKHIGYGAMQLAGPGVFGPAKDRDAALAVLREVMAAGINHIDTCDYYGPHVTNQLSVAHLRENLAAAQLILPDAALARLESIPA